MTVTKGRPLADDSRIYLGTDVGRRTRRGGSLTGGGTAGNERLTTAVGALLLVLLALVAGVVLAVLVIPDFGPWVNGIGLFHHHHH
jgi:hypothetical protein